MAYENGVVTKPVSTSDVCSAIGEGTHKVGYLCTSSSINIYSKRKPMRNSTLSELTDTQRIAGNWGYHVPDISQLRTIVTNIISEDGGTIPNAWNPAVQDTEPYEYMHYGWWYQRPQGGETSPYRLGDFNGYAHSTEEKLWWTNEIPSVISEAFDVSLFGQIDINSTDDVGSDTSYGSIGSLYNKVLLVGAYKSNTTVYGNLRYKTGPASSGSGTYYSIVHFSDTDLPLLFKDGEGTYYLYFFLVDRDQFTGGSSGGYLNPMQNLDSTGTYYDGTTYAALGDKMNKCISLPIARKVVTYAEQPPTSPIEDFTFTLASGGSITYTAARGRFIVSFPQLTATNTSTTSQRTIYKTNLYMSVFLQGISDSSKRWESSKISMGQTGTLSVNAGVSGTVFSSASVNFTDTSVIEFLNGDLISDYHQTAFIYYYDSTNDIYWDVATMSIQ